MVYEKANYAAVEPLAPGMHFLRDELDCSELGVTILEADAGWEGKPHDHADEGEEEVYVLLEGAGNLTVEGESVPIEPGDAIRVDPEATRQLTFDEESLMVIAGAP